MTTLKIHAYMALPSLDTFPLLGGQRVLSRDKETILVELGEYLDTTRSQERWLNENPLVTVYTVSEQKGHPPADIALWLNGKRGDMSTEQIANEIGVHKTTVHNWLAGRRRPNQTNRTLLARLFGRADVLEPVYPNLLLPQEVELGRHIFGYPVIERNFNVTPTIRLGESLL